MPKPDKLSYYSLEEALFEHSYTETQAERNSKAIVAIVKELRSKGIFSVYHESKIAKAVME